MNLSTGFSSPQTIFYQQRLPVDNIVKPRILLNKTASPILTMARSNNHYGSPQLSFVYKKHQNQENMTINISKRSIFYSPSVTESFENKPEIYQRNLSPQALSVLDILNKIKDTNAFQINKLKMQIKPPIIAQHIASNIISSGIENSTFQRSLVPMAFPQDDLKESKCYSMKRSCDCSPKNKKVEISKSRNNIEITSDNETNVYQINLKNNACLSPQNQNFNNANKIKKENSEKRGESPRNRESPRNITSYQNLTANSPSSSKLLEFDNKYINLEKNVLNANKNPKSKIVELLDSIIKRKSPKNEDILIKPESFNNTQSPKKILNTDKADVYVHNVQDPYINNNNNFNEKILYTEKSESNADKEDKTERLAPKKSQEKGYIQDLLGKINNCLSKTNDILHKTTEEKKVDNSQHISQRTEKNMTELGDESNDIKITTSPVKELQFESNDAMAMQNQFNEPFKSFNINSNSLQTANPFDKKYLNNHFEDCTAIDSESNIKKVISNISNECLNINQKDLIISNDKKDSPVKIENTFDQYNKMNGNNFNSILKEKFSPIIEKIERDEDKENNGPFINIYTHKSSSAIPLSPTENKADNHNIEILKESLKEKQTKNTDVLENPYNIESNDQIMKSPETSNEENDDNQLIIQAYPSHDSKYNVPLQRDDKLKEEKFKENSQNFKKKYNNKNKHKNYQGQETRIKKNSKITEKIERNLPIIEEVCNDKMAYSTKENESVDNKTSYAKIAQKNIKMKDIQVKKSQILVQISSIDKEIQTMELDAQKEKIEHKMMKFYDNYKAYKHKLPSIQENEDSMKRKSQAQTPISKTPEIQKSQKIQKNNGNNNIAIERCHLLYTKGIEGFQRKKIEIEENHKKAEILQKTICPFKPEFIAKKVNETILKEKSTHKPLNDNSSGLNLLIPTVNEKKHEKLTFKRSLSQNNAKKSNSAKDILKLNKSMSPQKKFEKFSKKPQGIKSSASIKNLISPRSTASSKTRTLSKGNINNNYISSQYNNYNNIYNSPIIVGNLLKKNQANRLDQHLNGEIFDILKIFSGINDVLANKKHTKINEEIHKESNATSSFDKLNELSPIKPSRIEENNKSFNDGSINDTKNQLEIRNSFEKVLGLLDQKHQSLLIKSVEMTKKVEKIFKENSSYAS